VRCVVRIDEHGYAQAFSRQGKEFKTLDNLLRELEQYPELRGMVLDGECCIVDGNGDEDFKSIMKEITRKDHTIVHPMYQMFDMMTCEEFDKRSTKRRFSERFDALVDFYYGEDKEFQYCKTTPQVLVSDQNMFEELYKEAQARGWEGLVIRKDDCTICKRSDSMLKVKGFQDAEYVVEGLDIGPFRVIASGLEIEEDVMTRAFITHKGNRVSVGSGWSLEQRRYYKEHPEELVGKTITVQYFEETTDKDGNLSLRFPVCKCVYESGRDL
jgi:DNA ligase-1